MVSEEQLLSSYNATAFGKKKLPSVMSLAPPSRLGGKTVTNRPASE